MTENPGSKKLMKTFLSYSIPCIIGMFLTSFIVIADGMFIAKGVGEIGLAAVNITLPVLYVFLGIAIMTGIGGATIATSSLGEKKFKRADESFTFTIVINAVINTVLLFILIIFEDRITGVLNAKGAVLPYVRDYLGTIKYYYILSVVSISFSIFIRSEGRPQFALVFGLVGNLINIVLDYIFVLKLDYGMGGAALASVISVSVPVVFQVLYFMSGKSTFHFSSFKFDLKVLRNIIFNGSSELISQFSISITTYLFNLVILKRLGIEGVAAFAVVGYISFIESMILTGIAQGIHPLISYNFGAKNRETIMALLDMAIKACFYVGIATLLVSFGASEYLVKVFSKGQDGFADIARFGLRVFSISFLFNGYNVIASAYFTSLGDARVSAIISSLRSLVVITVLILVLPDVFGDAGIWISVPLTELITMAVSFMYIQKSKAAMNFVCTAE